MLLSASQAMPPVSAPSPMTATTWCVPEQPALLPRLRQAVRVRQRRRRVGVLDDVVGALRAARVARQAAPLPQLVEAAARGR